MLNWKVVTETLSSFTAISFVLCVGYGLLAPPALHPSWLLEAFLPGFKWLSVGSFALGGRPLLRALQLFRTARGSR
jgi:hypothetical protein